MRILNAFSVIALAFAVSMSVGCGDDSSRIPVQIPQQQNAGGAPASGGTAASGTTPAGGDQPAGGAAAVPEPMGPSMMCEAAATHSAPEGEYSPATAFTAHIPGNVAKAKEAGCNSVGANAGTGLSTLLALAGDLNSFVRKNDAGEYELLLLAHMTGWAAGEPASAHKLQLFIGEYKDDQFLIDLDSFNEKDVTKVRSRIRCHS